jgi:hypothetical protein
MAVNETRAVSVTIEGDLLAPAFLPLLELWPGHILIPNQSQLAVTGTPLPLELQVMLCKTGTELGTPAEGAVLSLGEVFNVTSDKPHVLEGNVPPLSQGGVLGLFVPVAMLTTGAKVEGVLSIVR